MLRRLLSVTACLLLSLGGPSLPAQGQAQLGDDEAERQRIRELGLGASRGGSSSAKARISAESDEGPLLTERQRAAHVLNRMAFGPKPGQVEQVMEMGVENWMRQQLNPRSIQSPYLDEHVADHYPSLSMTNGQVFRKYRPPYSDYKNNPPTQAERDKRMQEQRQRSMLRNEVRGHLRDSVYYRAIHSEKQFEEVIVAFWREHFSIDQSKDDVAYLANNWEEQIIRRHAFGRFEDFLMATARHPAMLVYLDNIVSQKPLTEKELALIDKYGDRDEVPRSVRALQRQRGLNENYARELMELHSLGVDREYTQHDVTDLARVFTGWTARWSDGSRYGDTMMSGGERRDGGADYVFHFNADVHDMRNKVVLGSRLNGGGEEQGIRVIKALARHKFTADFISRKLCRYLLRDDPSEALVAEIAKVYRKTNGNLPKVYEAIVFSDDFFYRQNHRVKYKTPFEFVVSAVRVTGAQTEHFKALDNALELMGQPTYQCPDPTGWYDTAEAWLDPGVLVYRWTFALDLAANRLEGVRVPEGLLANLPGDELRRKIEGQLLPAGVSDRTSGIINDTFGSNPSAQDLVGVLLGSPEFQQQ